MAKLLISDGAERVPLFQSRRQWACIYLERIKRPRGGFRYAAAFSCGAGRQGLATLVDCDVVHGNRFLALDEAARQIERYFLDLGKPAVAARVRKFRDRWE